MANDYNAGLWAVSICRPWANLTIWKYRPLLNRVQKPPAELLGKRIAIHARYHWDPVGSRLAWDIYRLKLTEENCPTGILGTVLLVDGFTVDSLPGYLSVWSRHEPFKWQVAIPILWSPPVFHKGKLNEIWQVPPEIIP